MSTRIATKIVDYSVVQSDATVLQMPIASNPQSIIVTTAKKERPPLLHGTTYKVLSPLSEHAMYVTINDILEDGKRSPFEMFVNSKNMEHYQWIVALTRTISAVFRHGGDVSFLVEELKSVFDPKGGYFKKGGKWMPSLVAEIGDVIEEHLSSIGLSFKVPAVNPSARNAGSVSNHTAMEVQCEKCLQFSVVVSEGCSTCMSCGDSKCG